jgi:hypothetical protein
MKRLNERKNAVRVEVDKKIDLLNPRLNHLREASTEAHRVVTKKHKAIEKVRKAFDECRHQVETIALEHRVHAVVHEASLSAAKKAELTRLRRPKGELASSSLSAVFRKALGGFEQMINPTTYPKTRSGTPDWRMVSFQL